MKRQLLPSMCVVLLSTWGALAQDRVPDALAQAMRERQTAVARHDASDYARVLADDLTSVDRAGWLRNKAAAIADMLASSEAAATAPNRTVQRYTDAAVHTTDNGGRASVIQVWVREGGKWVIVAQQGTTRRNGATPTPATQRSSPLPSSVGAPTEVEAVNKAIESGEDAIARRDAGLWVSMATERFVGTEPDGEFLGRDEWLGKRAITRHTVRSSSVRIHGTVAVATARLARTTTGGAESSAEAWRTIVLVKVGGRWLFAASIETPITGAA